MSILKITCLDHFSKDEDTLDITFAQFVGSIVSESNLYIRLECWWVWIIDTTFVWFLHKSALGVPEINILKRCIIKKESLGV